MMDKFSAFNHSILEAARFYDRLTFLTFALVNRIQDAAVLVGNSKNRELVNQSELEKAYKTINEGFDWFASNVKSKSSEMESVFYNLRQKGLLLFDSLESEELSRNDLLKLRENLDEAYSSLEQAHNSYTEAKEASDSLNDSRISKSAISDARSAILSILTAYHSGLQLLRRFLADTNHLLNKVDSLDKVAH